MFGHISVTKFSLLWTNIPEACDNTLNLSFLMLLFSVSGTTTNKTLLVHMFMLWNITVVSIVDARFPWVPCKILKVVKRGEKEIWKAQHN